MSEHGGRKFNGANNADFSGRHEDIGHIFERHLNVVKDYLPPDASAQRCSKSPHRGLLYDGVLY
jgi:hypothetical protein